MKSLILALKSAPIVYITRDLERALAGLHLDNYFIITNAAAFAKELAQKHQNIILVEDKTKLDTIELLQHPTAEKFLSTLKSPQILVFKNTSLIEKACAAQGWTLLNPPASLASTVEEKISQLDWLGELQKLLPPHEIKLGGALTWEGKKYIVQFNRAHTGGGTMLIESAEQVKELQKKFPAREMRVTTFISGPALTNNNIVWGSAVLTGNINYQITGLSPFTNLPFATIGNDWSLPATLLNKKQRQEYLDIARAVGQKLADSGWKGLFGVDAILDETTGQVYLIEINARQPASTTYESELQQSILEQQTVILSEAKNLSRLDPSATPQDDDQITTFEAHLAALLGLPGEEKLATVSDGAQIIQRVTKSVSKVKTGAIKALNQLGKTVAYENTEPGSDLLRIQLQKSIMKGHNQLNDLGVQIQSLLQK